MDPDSRMNHNPSTYNSNTENIKSQAEGLLLDEEITTAEEACGTDVMMKMLDICCGAVSSAAEFQQHIEEDLTTFLNNLSTTLLNTSDASAEALNTGNTSSGSRRRIGGAQEF